MSKLVKVIATGVAMGAVGAMFPSVRRGVEAAANVGRLKVEIRMISNLTETEVNELARRGFNLQGVKEILLEGRHDSDWVRAKMRETA